jgi:hypothetical protein
VPTIPTKRMLDKVLAHAALSQDLVHQQHSPHDEIAYQHNEEDARAEPVQKHDWHNTIETECSRLISEPCELLLVLVRQIFV